VPLTSSAMVHSIFLIRQAMTLVIWQVLLVQLPVLIPSSSWAVIYATTEASYVHLSTYHTHRISQSISRSQILSVFISPNVLEVHLTT
jgi:hypothetical protein